MAGGVGVAGFGGGFGKGLASILLHNREVKREEEQRAESRRLQGHMAALPIYLQHAQETGDYSVVEEVLGQIEPDLVKKFKKEGSPFQVLGPLMSNPELIGKPSVTGPPDGTTSPELEQEPKEPLIPTRVAGVPPPPPKTFLGMPVLTPEQRLERADQASDPAVKMRLAQRYAKETGKSLDESMDRFGLRAYSGSMAPRYGGILKGDQVPEGLKDSLGQPIEASSYYRVQVLPEGQLSYIPTIAPGLVSAGTQLERAAVLMGYRRLADVPPEERPKVEAKAKELETQFGYSGSYGRGIGGRTAEMDMVAKSGIVETIIDNPLIWAQLTSEVKGKLAPLLDAKGFDFTRGTELTPSMAAGISRLTSSLKILQELDASLTQKTGVSGRVAGTAQDWWASLTQEDSPANIYRGVSDALLPALARASGEVGNLAEKEQVRYERLAPKVSDAANVRRAKYAAIQYLIDAANRGATAAELSPFLDYMKFAQKPGVVKPGAKPTTATPIGPTGAQMDDKGNLIINGKPYKP